MKDQGKLYDNQYVESVFDEQGLPDWKIVDYKKVKGKKFLSIGGGMGADMWFLTDANEVVLLDASKQGVRVANKHGVKAKIFDVTRKLPYPDESFDVVVLKDILEHVLEPVELLMEAKRVVKRRGYIIVSLPNHFWWWFRIRMLFGANLLWKTLQHDHSRTMDEWDYMHVRFFTWSGVKRMMKLAGLKIDKKYWDFGTWAHYSDPEMFYTVLKNKKKKSKMAKLFLNLVWPLYEMVDWIFPRKMRAEVVDLAPGLLCAGFYIRLKK